MADIYQLQAIYFANVLYQQEGVVACVHLENKDDVLFWDAMLQSQHPGHYYFITHSRSPKTENASGRGQCLNYKPYLNERFFIAIDSDMHYLTGETDVDASHFICQTYTYSWENHYCEAPSLQSRFENECPEKAMEFNFIEFLSEYSKTVYKPLLLLLHCIKNGKSDFTRKLFDACLPHQCNHNEIENNGAACITKIKKSFEPYLNSSFAQSINFSEETAYFENLGLTETNAYLHVRGHNLYDLINTVGKALCYRTEVSFKNDIFMKDLPQFNYWQIKKVASDISTIV